MIGENNSNAGAPEMLCKLLKVSVQYTVEDGLPGMSGT
jgi:hypothetical protein